MYNIEEAAEELHEVTAWQTTPYPVYDDDYVKIVVRAIKKLFVDTNHPEEFNRDLYITSETGVFVYDYSFDILQEEYIFIISQMNFYTKIYDDTAGDGAVSYTTDALSVTGAKEGYKSIQQRLDILEQERIRVFHKIMSREQGD